MARRAFQEIESQGIVLRHPTLGYEINTTTGWLSRPGFLGCRVSDQLRDILKAFIDRHSEPVRYVDVVTLCATWPALHTAIYSLNAVLESFQLEAVSVGVRTYTVREIPIRPRVGPRPPVPVRRDEDLPWHVREKHVAAREFDAAAERFFKVIRKAF